MNKKGEGEQFNWIFVIVAGSIILGFFIMFTFKYVELQEKRQDVDTVRFFGGKVIAASSRSQVGSGGAAIDSNEQEGLRFGYNVNLGYRCSVNESAIIINKGDNAWYKLKDEVVFMDSSMKVNSLDLWILPWNYPFFVTNFIYLGDPKTTFYLVWDGSTKEFVENLDVTSAFKIEKISRNQLSLKQNSKVVFFSESKPSKQDILALKKNITDVGFVYVSIARREASFYDLKQGSWSDRVKFYISKDNYGQIFGTIFSDSAENFECNVKKSLDRAKVIAEVYSRRAILLSQLDRRPGCHYSEIAGSLSKYARGNFDLIETISSENLAGAGCIWVF